MIDTSITEEVLSLTFNGDSFPMTTGISPEKIKLFDPKNTGGIKRIIEKGETKLVVIDGCLSIIDIVNAVVAILAVRKRKRLNIVVCIIHQDPVNITGAIWEKNPENVIKYLKRA